jgi:glycosyltransferase involved in cell wall biosynthesis
MTTGYVWEELYGWHDTGTAAGLLTPGVDVQPYQHLESSETKHLAEGMIEALSGQRQMPSAAACQAYIKQNYDWQAIAHQIKSVYEQVLSQSF